MGMIKDQQDAFGHILYDYLKSKGSFEIIERNDGYFDVTNAARVYFSEYKDWPEIERKAMRFVRGRVLDVGCGAGRHSLYLQRKGLQVLGADASPLAVKVCEIRGLRDVKVIPITRLSSKLGRFDTIIMLGNNFGLFGNFRRARWLLARFHAMTTAEARIITEVIDPYRKSDPSHLSYHKRNLERERMAGQIRIRVRYLKYTTPWFDYLFVSKAEMERMLAGTGWKVEKYLDSGNSLYIAVIVKE
jgi:hypothetical protein